MELPVVDATQESVAPFGVLLDSNVTPAIDIPFYPGRVVEGGDVGFRYRGTAVMQTAQVHPTPAPEVLWLERHLHLTQMFAAISGGSFIMVMAPPNTADYNKLAGNLPLPDLSEAMALRFPPHSVLFLHLGTWHDFPIAVDSPVTFLIANSHEVITTLQEAGEPKELDAGDVFKISLPRWFGQSIKPVA